MDQYDEYARKLRAQEFSSDDYDEYARKLKAGAVEDVAKAVAVAPVKAVTGLAGLPGTMREIGDMVRNKVAPYVPEWMRKVENFGTGIAAASNPLAFALPSGGDIRSAAERGLPFGKWHDPVTWQGKAADTATQAATMMGRNLVTDPWSSLAGVTGITAGTETARHLTNENPLAMFIGGLLGATPAAAVNAVKSRQGVVLKDALGKLTPEQIDEAIARQKAAQAQGVPLMGTESLDRGHQLASAVRASPSGNVIVDPFLAKRPEQVRAAVGRDILSKTGSNATPQEAAAVGQKAATKVIENAENFRTAQTSPYYKAAGQEPVPFSGYKGVIDAINAGRQHMPAQQKTFDWYLDMLKEPSAATGRGMDSLYRAAREAGDLSIMATPEDKLAAAVHKAVSPALESASATPSIVQGRQLYKDITRAVVEPRTSGPVGVVAGKTGFDPAAPSSWPRVSSVVSNADQFKASDVRTLAAELNATDKAAFPAIAHAWIANELDTAIKPLRSGPNPTAGAKFFDAVYGSPDQAAKFDQVMIGVAKATGADPKAVTQGARNLLKTLDLTGRTPGIGSQTQPRLEIGKEMGKSVISDTFNTVSAQPFGPWTQRLDDWIIRARYADIATAMTSPNSVELLVKMAKLAPNGLTAKYYAAALLGLGSIASGQ